MGTCLCQVYNHVLSAVESIALIVKWPQIRPFFALNLPNLNAGFKLG
jgi:hypothetical protein